MRPSTVRGTPFTKITSTGNEGFRQAGGNADNTVAPQFRGGGINTQGNTRGTPAQYAHGDSDEFSRTVSSDNYGKVIDDQMGDQSDPASNGNGVILSNMGQDYEDPSAQPTMDSPVPSDAPRFDTGTIKDENRAHLGRGRGVTAPNEAMSVDNLETIGGVMSRGMVGTSKASDKSELELTADDTLPAVGPAGRA